MIRDQMTLDVHPEIIVDNFAGGGGASTGIELALGRCVDVAINHDPEAVLMHEINHPQTRHYCESVWDVDPLEATQGRPVGLAWFSPDCKHFSKAKGGKPRDKRIRGLAWIVLRWAALVRPRVIMLENVEEFKTWGPLLDDGTPCPRRRGKTFRSFVHQLQEKGYAVETRELRACDYGAPTIRKRLFLIARCDGQPIVWPAPTHGAPDSAAVRAGDLLPWRTAADCIDWSIACPSIFERSRPLAEATMKRIARGIRRYVIEAAKPYIVTLSHGEGQPGKAQRWGSGTRDIDAPFQTVTANSTYAVVTPYLTEHANGSTQRNFDAGAPLRTQCAEVKGGHFAMVAPTLIQTGYGERAGQAPRAPGLDKPLGTVVAGGAKHALVSGFLAKHYGGHYDGAGVSLDGPTSTVTTVDHHALVAAQLVGCGGRAGQSRPRDAGEPSQTLTAKADTCIVTSHLAKLRNNQFGQATEEPMPTLTAGGGHVADVRAFLVKYYGEGGQDQDVRDPMHTIPTKDRMGLVTVAGQDYVIADIGMRMLEPHELYAAQGFPSTYVIAPTINGRRLPKHAQVRMCGNSVCPPLAAALVRGNVPDLAAWTPQEAKQQRIAA
ncbi:MULTISPECIES: DNA cytosine methyltransferase [unclassified Achromobacter]|uniref:DNA cytosine methyltransferase n=1 Tax=unclassified Achromobacter TaxID=2626865 RepID=UPI000B515A6B|nr:MULTISPECIES: DNA cytosine methyltransferase [unclassified Achromobacter]OWT69243.1 type II restriction endonuclease subunit M [Achromobacter sp. HZ34]OWT70648.1 type II restriction endonuclease subunit M [Achromobacter sp. HZ28]